MPKDLIAFHGDPKIKEKYLLRLKAHEIADEIIHGTYWEDGKGCAVGCTIHGDEHSAYETELGIPQWLAYVEDTLFENQPNKESKTFPRRFLEAIPVGADCEEALYPYLILVVRSVIPFCNDIVREAVHDVLSLLEENCRDKDKLAAAGDAAWAAARAAGDAAGDAAWAAAGDAAWAAAGDAWDAAWAAAAWAAAGAAAGDAAGDAARAAARAAGDAAGDAAGAAARAAGDAAWDAAAWAAARAAGDAWDAWDAAWAAAEKKHMKFLADGLIEILGNLKVKELVI
jgi:hypothetical protein